MLTIDGENCLLGRSARFPGTMWSYASAGFVEPRRTIRGGGAAVQTLRGGRHPMRAASFILLSAALGPSLLADGPGFTPRAISRDIVVDKAELEDARWVQPRGSDSDARAAASGQARRAAPIAIAHHIIPALVEDGVEFR